MKKSKSQKSAYAESVETQAKSVLSDATATLASINADYERLFPTASLADVEKKFSSQLTDPSNIYKISTWHDDATSTVRGQLLDTMEKVQTLEGWISLSYPPIEDGNNFGVSVQLAAVKQLQELREDLSKKVDSAVEYYKARAEATEKLTPTSSHITTSTESSVDARGGKDGDEKKATESTTVERKTSVPSDVDQHLRMKTVLAIDMKYYGEWKLALRRASNGFASAVDQIEKNMEKITKPRGGSRGSSGMMM